MPEQFNPSSDRSPEKPSRHERLLAEIQDYEAKRDKMRAEGVPDNDPELSFLLGRLSVYSDQLSEIVTDRTVEQFEHFEDFSEQ
jgi:hypothetical protein